MINNGGFAIYSVFHAQGIFNHNFFYLTLEPPVVELDLSVREGIQILAGQTLKIPATVFGRPAPKIEWKVEDGELNKETAEIINEGNSSVLTIASAERKDHGRYIITASNESGTKSAATRVEIFGKKCCF